MKKINYIFAPVLILVILLVSSCQKKYLDLTPLDAPTVAIYFKTPDQFKAGAAALYTGMIGLRPTNGSSIYAFEDPGSDINGGGYGWPTVLNNTDIYWNNAYGYLRAANYVIYQGTQYTGDPSGIKQYIAAGYFFRAWQHFFLMKRYGGVPIVNQVVDLNSPILYGPRNSRYEVTNQILRDLDVAIAGLPLEANIAAADKGQVSQQAAMAFKARVLLYEATYEKYVNGATDFAQGQKKGDSTATYLTQAATLAAKVMSYTDYQLFNGVDSLSTYYLFTLEDPLSNPKGLTKAANKEFILSNHYDYSLLTGNANITHTGGGLTPTRKMMDMYDCTDGLPPSVSPNFKGYNKMADEFINRDYRMRSLVQIPQRKYWGFGLTLGANYSLANYITTFNFPASITATYPNLSSSPSFPGYNNRKWVSENPNRVDYSESWDWPQIRLAEVYLIYAEAKCELGGGTISDADLNLSINKVRARAGVAPLTNALIAPYPGLTMLGEIRRERTIELYGENTRYDDLFRWGIAETELNARPEGYVVSYNGSPTQAATITNPYTNQPVYKASIYTYGVDPANGALYLSAPPTTPMTKKNYLYAIPQDQINANRNLVQNPGY
jgi:starch-binding outer membrane protein, SusD/RagB family